MRTFIYGDERSHKFWSIELKGTSFVVTWGKVGTSGQSQTKSFPDESKAKKEHDKLIAEKTSKGYIETTTTAPASSLREALESAIRENPGDRAAHMAYADWLSEQSDPADVTLAEFMRVQLALEDASLSASERKKLQKREQALIEKHSQEWAGDWIKHAKYNGPEGRCQIDFAEPAGAGPVKKSSWYKSPVAFVRGLPAEVVVGDMGYLCARGFSRAPQTRFVRRLGIGGFDYDFDEDLEEHLSEDEAEAMLAQDAEEATVQEFSSWPYMANLRVFQFGWTSDESSYEKEDDKRCWFQCHLSGRNVHQYVLRMPRLEELYVFAHYVDGDKLFSLPMRNLRVLQVYHSIDYPLEKLAKNDTLTNLTHLLCHPRAYRGEPSFTLKGLKALARSKHLKSLTHLRLRLTTFGDDGIKEIIDSGLIGRLKVLDLRHGQVSDKGAKLLAACPAVRNLELLDLWDNELEEEGIEALEATGAKVIVDQQHGSTADAEMGHYDEMNFLYQGDYE
jgi:uncharacterized protein (TIGR02996 family)